MASTPHRPPSSTTCGKPGTRSSARSGPRRPSSTRSTGASPPPSCASTTPGRPSCCTTSPALTPAPPSTARHASSTTSTGGRSAAGLPMSSRSAPCCRWRRWRPRTRRAERRNDDGKVTSVVTIHEELAADDGPLPGWLVTVDELTGYGKPGDRARDVVAAHVSDPVERDAVDVVLTMAGIERTGTVVEPGIPLDPDLPAAEGFRLVLANLDDAIEVNLPGTVDDLDSEFLHDLRVAVRRTRSILRHGRDVIDPDVLAWAEPGFKRDRRRHEPAARPRRADPGVGRRGRRARRCGPARRSSRCTASCSATAPPPTTSWPATCAPATSPGCCAAGARSSAGRPIPSGPASTGRCRSADVVRDRITSAQKRLLEHGRAITPGHAGRRRPRDPQGRQEVALPARVLRRPAPDRGAQGVRQAAQEAAGPPRRAPGRRGPRDRAAPRRRAPARHHRAGDVRRGRPARRAPRTDPAGRTRRVRRAVRRVRRAGHTPGAARHAGRRRAGEGPRDVQHQGRRREDDRGRQPRRRGRPFRARACCCGTSIRRARPRSSCA